MKGCIIYYISTVLRSDNIGSLKPLANNITRIFLASFIMNIFTINISIYAPLVNVVNLDFVQRADKAVKSNISFSFFYELF